MARSMAEVDLNSLEDYDDSKDDSYDGLEDDLDESSDDNNSKVGGGPKGW